MAKRGIEKKYLRRRRFALIVLLLIAAVIFMYTFSGFNIISITVNGDPEIYTTQEILTASSVKRGDNIFSVNAKKVEKMIMSKLNYITDVRVDKRLPNKLVITVQEVSNVLIVETESGSYAINDELVFAGLVNSYEGKSLRIYGIVPESCETGAVLKEYVDKNDDTARGDRADKLGAIICALNEAQLTGRVTEIHLEDRLELTLLIENRIYVKLGTSANLSRKMMMLNELLNDKIASEEYGTLDLAVAGKATFSPMSKSIFLERFFGIIPEPDEQLIEDTEESEKDEDYSDEEEIYYETEDSEEDDEQSEEENE